MMAEVREPLRVAHPESGEEVEVRLAACGARDRGEQVLLFNRCFKKRIDERALAWRYDESPHGQSVSWVARPAGLPGVSGYACTPRRALVEGDEGTLALAGQTGDVMTDPEWRQRGLFSALDRAAVAEAGERGFALAFGLPNRKSAHIFVELGWEVVGSVRPWTFVLRADAASWAARSTDGRLAAWTTPWAARRGATARRALERGGAGVRAETLEGAFPADVLDVARSVEPRFRWMARRDKEWLDWRYVRAPSRLHRVQLLRGAGGELEGYVVVQHPRPGEGVGYLIDLLARSEAGVDAGLAAGLDALERAGASVAQATAIDGSWWREQLARAGFRPPRAEKVLSVILHPLRTDHPLVAAARDPARWYFTDGDRDDETMG
jgi:GNAT superfamily N-acetyltransferase